ncbi:ATP-binding protein [Streptomyces canus]|uniref:ATP-binding protein n=1 Tax=Streptomyces canus TaxID=58343 RepID=A0A124HV75_9ACTN|nr:MULTISPECIES: NACHT domain-containing protein [Streptomyces]KUN57521.1 ATP-binding protein [Streptomyces canus]MDI5913387.1 NACHT domain-containing protein [Streptomyces sp. 12257]
MLAETAALRLGTTVANAAGRLWLGGKQREQERLLSMEELVRVRVSGIRLQREVKQQFDQITNAVFDRLEPFLKHAFQRLEEGGRQAVIDAVSDMFTQADLSDEALLAANAQPAELIRYITGSVSAPVGLNETESRLYEVLFAECVEYYVRIVRSLPVFEERVAGEVLARTATLGAEVARILERLPDRSLFAPDGTDHDTAFRRTYLELVSRDLDEVELFRRISDHATAPRVRLSVAYVSLRATGDDGKRRRAARSSPLTRPEMSYWEEAGGESSGMRVEAALSGASRVLLRGEAGSGKTTLLRWLAVMAARGAFTGELANWNGLTPIFIKLREYSGRTPPNPEAMLDGIAGPITGIMPRGWVERQLDGGTALLLIDGVDELLDRDRRVVRDWLHKLLGQYDGVRVVVTSRPAAAGADWLRREDFTALHLDRMTPPDLAAFVRQWHQALRELGGELPCAVDELPEYEQSLLTSLKDRAHLQSLAGTPLLAAMLCAMHLNRGRQLPRDRMELYRNALHTLVHDRDADRNVPSAVDSKLSLGDKLVILRDLAWRLSDNNRSEIALEKAAAYVAAKLRAMRHLDVLDGDQVLEQLRHRSGILRSPAEGRMDFVHRTFQEYLAAEEAAEEDRIGNLVGRAHLDLWRETIIMAAGHANTRQREELLGGILSRADEEPRHARTLRLLAAACQETLPSVKNELAVRLDEAVTKLLPARRKTDPPALAAVGPSLLRWLPRSLEQLSENGARQTVRTVALIGGEESLELLAGYVGDDREGVVNELIHAWDYFDADTYADVVLSRLQLAGHQVVLNHSGQLHAASRLRSLEDVRIDHPVRGLEFLAELPPLRQLWVLTLSEGADLSYLQVHPGLEHLMLWGSGPMRGTSVLSDLPELSWVGLPLSGDLDLNTLRLIPKLKVLNLSRTEGQDLSPLATLTSLRDLHVVGYDECAPIGLEELAGMTRLESLWLYDHDVNAWLAALKSSPPSLTELYLSRCILPRDHHAFAQFDNLELVSLTECRTPDGAIISALDIPGVQTLFE